MKTIAFKTACIAALVFGTAMTASAQDNPLLQPAENPLLQENTSGPSFADQARAIDLAATKDSNDPMCQNIRANYDQELAKIMRKGKVDDAGSLSQISDFSRSTRGTAYSLNRINRNITGDYSNGVSRTLGGAADKVNRGAGVVNEVNKIGGMLGIKGKSKEEKARKKAAKLDAQAMDAVSQVGCPMSTFS